MGQMQQKAGGCEAVKSAIKSIEHGSNNTSGEANSPILNGGDKPSTHSGFTTSGFKSGQSPNKVVRKMDK